MRTQLEIVHRIESIKPRDFFGFEIGDLVMALDFEHAKPYLKPDCTEAEWNEGRPTHTEEAYREKIREYLPFAWEKANNERGISASRSQSHFRSWIWLAGDTDNLARVEAAEYAPYGKPKLELIQSLYAPAAAKS